MNNEESKNKIKAKIVDIAKKNNIDASDLDGDQIIPMTGYLDSMGIVELVVWYEAEFDLKVDQDDINIDNFGSLNLMVDYLQKA